MSRQIVGPSKEINELGNNSSKKPELVELKIKYSILILVGVPGLETL